MNLSQDQAKTLKELINWYSTENKTPYITLGGYAGTGKTTLIAILKSTLPKIKQTQAKSAKDKKMKIALCSYTGRATQNLKNKLKELDCLHWTDTISTIHGLIYDAIDNSQGVIIGCKRKPELDVDLIIIDEASMIDRTIWEDLLTYKVPIIAVGDHGQLPPINGNFNLMQNPYLKLEKIHRQAKGNPIINLSKAARETGNINKGKYSASVIKYTQEDYDYTEVSTTLLENYTKNMLILCGYNSTRVKINQFIRSALGFDLPVPLVGDRVICLRNNHTQNVYNGMLGTILRLEPGAENFYEAEIKMDESIKNYTGTIYAPQFNSESPINFTKDRAKIGDNDIFDFGYALTVHKAQGSQAEKVVLFEERFAKMTDDDWRRWLYTGVTRAQNELYIFGD